MRATYRVGVIGSTGRGDYGHGLDVVWKDVPGCEVVGVADPDPTGRSAASKRLGDVPAFADYRELLDHQRPDIVSIAPRWVDQHRELVLAAAERGIHIYLEKPMCRSLVEADEMVAACERHGVKLAIAFQTRYSPLLQVSRDLLFDGRLGELLELRGRGKEDARGGGEDLWVLGSHIMNLIHQLGGEPNWCSAFVTENGRPIQRGDVHDGPEGLGPLAGDTVQAVYGLDGSRYAFFASRRGTAGGRFGLQILGSRGILEILTGYLPQVHLLEDPTWSPGRSGKEWVPVSSAGVGQSEPLPDGGLHAGNVAACRDLLAAIEHDRQPEASVYEGRTAVEMIVAAFESQRAGTPVRLPLADRTPPLPRL